MPRSLFPLSHFVVPDFVSSLFVSVRFLEDGLVCTFILLSVLAQGQCPTKPNFTARWMWLYKRKVGMVQISFSSAVHVHEL